jgi:hypothetical protein
MRARKSDFYLIEGEVLTMLLQPTFARVPLSSVVPGQGVVLPGSWLPASGRAKAAEQQR